MQLAVWTLVDGMAVYAVELPGHDVAAASESFAPLTQVVDRVVAEITARGLTDTSPDPEDGRRLLVSLTRAGQQLAEKAAPNAVAISKETLAPLDAREREILMALLDKLR